jgi:hypothetical protein
LGILSKTWVASKEETASGERNFLHDAKWPQIKISSTVLKSSFLSIVIIIL